MKISGLTPYVACCQSSCNTNILKVRSNVLDATRVSDGLMVNIKLVMTGNEPDIAKSLSQPPLCDYPQNHSVPILDHFPSEESPELSFIVMPFLRAIDDPPFYFVDEVIDFVDQVLEVRQPCWELQPSHVILGPGVLARERYCTSVRTFSCDTSLYIFNDTTATAGSSTS